MSYLSVGGKCPSYIYWNECHLIRVNTKLINTTSVGNWYVMITNMQGKYWIKILVWEEVVVICYLNLFIRTMNLRQKVSIRKRRTHITITEWHRLSIAVNSIDLLQCMRLVVQLDIEYINYICRFQCVLLVKLFKRTLQGSTGLKIILRT